MPTERSNGSRASSMRTSFNSYLDDFGTTVTLRRTTETTDSMGRITSVSTTTSSVQADIQWITKKDLMHLNVGDVKIGDGMIFFKYNQVVAIDDEVEFNSERYRVTQEVEGERVGGDIVYKGYIIQRNAQV